MMGDIIGKKRSIIGMMKGKDEYIEIKFRIGKLLIGDIVDINIIVGIKKEGENRKRIKIEVRIEKMWRKGLIKKIGIDRMSEEIVIKVKKIEGIESNKDIGGWVLELRREKLWKKVIKKKSVESDESRRIEGIKKRMDKKRLESCIKIELIGMGRECEKS